MQQIVTTSVLHPEDWDLIEAALHDLAETLIEEADRHDARRLHIAADDAREGADAVNCLIDRIRAVR